MARVSNFEDVAFWNGRYSQPKAKAGFDWYLVDFAMLRSHLVAALTSVPHTNDSSCSDAQASSGIAVVDIGCGNSCLLFDMAADAEVAAVARTFSHSPTFVGVDYSTAAVDCQREKQAAKKALQEEGGTACSVDFCVADAKDMRSVLRDASVLCVTDKATLD